MELVLSPGRLGGGDKSGSPFHNEEVREWSHVDRLTGMLEHARIETGRWQTRHRGSAQAYGKVIDSRERNSADGNVVQKARRQVEVFQSQGIGGRSVQVVRASQWSSSRITGSNSTSPVSVSMNESQFRNGNTDDLVLQASGKSVPGRLMQIQNCGGDESLAKLSQVSRLCRQINAEAINKRTNVHSATNNKPQMIHASPLLNSRFKRLDISKENVKKTSGFLQNTNSTLKTTSNEDLTNSIDNSKTDTKFSRGCKARRSLQIQKSIDSSSAPEKTTVTEKIILLGFGRIENSSVSNGDSGFGEQRSLRTNSTTSSDSDQETCIVKNERKAMKSYVLGMSDTDNDLIASSSLPVSEDEFPTEPSADSENSVGISKLEYFRPTAILLKPKTIQAVPTAVGKPNKTVVHLNNKFITEQKTDQLLSNSLEKSLLTGNIIRPIAGMQSRVQSLADRFSNRNNNFISNANESMQLDAQSSFLSGRKQSFDSASRIGSLISRSTAMVEGPLNAADEIEPILHVQQTQDNKLLSDDQSCSVVRPVKKVGFCKTEVHFAAESGKVNIVETDCKPPPSNRFRRRRRNSLVANGTMPINKNLPLIHFGDTSYEKYIFGQGNNGGSFKSDFTSKDYKLPGEVEEPDLSAQLQIAEINNDNDQKSVTPAKEIKEGGWGARIKTILQSDPELSINDNGLGLNTADKNYDALDETIVDHSFKGHTTMVNLGANSISKQLQKHRNGGKCNTISTGIQLQFSTKIEKLRPIITSNNIITVDAAKKSLTKIIPMEKTNTPSPSNVSKIPRPLIQAQQSVLKSAHLVMNLNKINNFKSSIITKNSENESSSANSVNNSLNLKNLLSSFHNNCTEMVTCHRHSHRVDVANNNHKRNTPTSITVNSNNKINYPTRFIPLRSKYFNERETTPLEKEKKIDEVVCNEDSRENQQLQYSSGSEQADEEVRSYMLGTKNDRREIMQIQKFANSVTMEEKWSIQNSEEYFGARRTIRETRISNDDCIDKPVEQNHINGLSIDDNDDDELDIVNSGLPAVEEMCFEPNKTVEKDHVDKLVANESNIVTTDNENNKVLLNIVKTHEPIVARVEDRLHSPEVGRKLFAIKKLRSHNSTQQPERKDKAHREITAHQISVNKSFLMSSNKTRIKPEAKDHCDETTTKEITNGSNDDSNTTDPTYVNVFENEKQNVPIYENYNVERRKNLMDNKYLKTNNHNGDIKVSSEFKILTDATNQPSNSNYDTETTLSNTDCEGKNLKQYSNTSRSSGIAQLTTITENNSIKRSNIDGQKIKLSKTRSKKIPRPPSSMSSIESIHRSSVNESAKESQTRSLHNRSTRSSRLHRVANNRETSGNESSERYSSANEKKKKNSSEQITNTRTSRLNHSTDSSTATRNLNGSTRSKKPIEIVYQTAVYNMKNEKLSKSRSKESKTPRYINDLICGSRPAKRSTDVRHVKGSAPSQQRVHHKSASPTHRHWK